MRISFLSWNFADKRFLFLRKSCSFFSNFFSLNELVNIFDFSEPYRRQQYSVRIVFKQQLTSVPIINIKIIAATKQFFNYGSFNSLFKLSFFRVRFIIFSHKYKIIPEIPDIFAQAKHLHTKLCSLIRNLLLEY